MVPVLLAAAVAFVAAFVAYGFHPLKRWRYRHIPGPRPSWLIGNLLEVISEGQEKASARWGKQYGPVWCFWIGALPVVMTDEPELARKVLTKPARHKLYNLHVGEQEQLDSNSILTVTGDTWKTTRNAWQPFFSKVSLTKQAQLMADSAGRMCNVLASAADQGVEVDIYRMLGNMTMDVVGTTAFGVDFNTQESTADGAAAQDASGRRLSSVHTPADRLIWAVRVFFELFGLENTYFALFFLFPEMERPIKRLANLFPNSSFKKELEARKTLTAVSRELMQQSRQEGGAQAAAGAVATQRPSAVDPGSFLALILPSSAKVVGKASLGELWATNQASTFMLAGYETTANALAFTIYLLARNPDAEAKLVAEIDAFGSQRVPTTEELAVAFPYVAAVVQESLRMYPPGPIAVRDPKGGMMLGGYAVPEDAALQVNIYSMQNSERYWREPGAFKPERFLAGTPEAAEVIPGAHVPFGEGARKCIGYRFALQEASLALIKLYQQYTFRLLPGQVPLQVKTAMTMGPEHGVRVTVHRRQAACSKE